MLLLLLLLFHSTLFHVYFPLTQSFFSFHSKEQVSHHINKFWSFHCHYKYFTMIYCSKTWKYFTVEIIYLFLKVDSDIFDMNCCSTADLEKKTFLLNNIVVAPSIVKFWREIQEKSIKKHPRCIILTWVK